MTRGEKIGFAVQACRKIMPQHRTTMRASSLNSLSLNRFIGATQDAWSKAVSSIGIGKKLFIGELLTHQYLLIYTVIMPQAVGKDIGRLVTIFHALSDETRLRIIACLKDEEQCI
jgi:hypothetical protein